MEGDWSGAAFWLAANALGSGVTVDGLAPASAQGDRAAQTLFLPENLACVGRARRAGPHAGRWRR